MLVKISFNFHLVSEPLTFALFKKKFMIFGHSDFSSFWFKKSFMLMLIQFSATGFH